MCHLTNVSAFLLIFSFLLFCRSNMRRANKYMHGSSYKYRKTSFSKPQIKKTRLLLGNLCYILSILQIDLFSSDLLFLLFCRSNIASEILLKVFFYLHCLIQSIFYILWLIYQIRIKWLFPLFARRNVEQRDAFLVETGGSMFAPWYHDPG